MFSGRMPFSFFTCVIHYIFVPVALASFTLQFAFEVQGIDT